MSLSDMQNNIHHVVHLMFENRGFDHFMGWLWNDTTDKPTVNIPALRKDEQAFYGVPQDAGGNPTGWLPDDKSYFLDAPYTGGKMPIHKGSWGYCNMPLSDPGEVWDDITQQIYGPYENFDLPAEKLMKGFYINYAEVGKGGGSDKDILATFTPTELPVLNTLAKSFAVSDMWFASAPTQTNPNRAFSLGGSSLGRLNNLSSTGVPYSYLRTIFTVFNDAKVPWKLYADKTWVSGEYFTQYMFPLGMPNTSAPYGSIADFANDVKNDKLPAFSYIEPIFFSWETIFDFNSYHPPGSTYQGEKFLKLIYDTLKSNPNVWKNTLLIITFDEHGGTYDHVFPPTNAPPPDELDPPYQFGRYGVRVPTLLLSPWVPPGSVFRAGYYPGGDDASALPYDHTSVLATLCKWKKIPYQNPTDVGWLRQRTRVAPTFEDVITNTFNKVMPPVSLYDCSWGLTAEAETVGSSDVPTGLIRQIVSRLTPLPRDGEEAGVIADRIVAECETKADLEAALHDLAGKYS